MKEFTTAAKAARDSSDVLEVKLDADTLKCYRPTEAQIVMLVSAQASEIRSESSRMAMIIDASISMFDADSRRVLQSRLLNPDDDFDFDGFLSIINYVVEEWAERPTKPSSDSTSLPENGGTTSEAGAQSKELTSSS